MKTNNDYELLYTRILKDKEGIIILNYIHPNAKKMKKYEGKKIQYELICRGDYIYGDFYKVKLLE